MTEVQAGYMGQIVCPALRSDGTSNEPYLPTLRVHIQASYPEMVQTNGFMFSYDKTYDEWGYIVTFVEHVLDAYVFTVHTLDGSILYNIGSYVDMFTEVLDVVCTGTAWNAQTTRNTALEG